MTGAKQSKKSYTLGKSKIKALFDNGNKFDNIPENIKGFEPYLNSSNNIKWIDWHSKNPLMMKVFLTLLILQGLNCYCNIHIYFGALLYIVQPYHSNDTTSNRLPPNHHRFHI